MATMKVSPEKAKFIQAFAKKRGLSTEEALDRILTTAETRIKALANYEKSTKGGGGKSKKTAKKATKAKAKTKAKTAGKSKGAKKAHAKKASAKARGSRKAAGTPKGFKSNSTSAPATPAPEATAAAN